MFQKTILALLIGASLLASGIAHAGETLAVLPSDKDPVPFPVPEGYDRCVIVVFVQSEQERTGKTGKVIDPPFSKFDADGLSAAWSDGLLKSVRHCQPRSA